VCENAVDPCETCNERFEGGLHFQHDFRAHAGDQLCISTKLQSVAKSSVRMDQDRLSLEVLLAEPLRLVKIPRGNRPVHRFPAPLILLPAEKQFAHAKAY